MNEDGNTSEKVKHHPEDDSKLQYQWYGFKQYNSDSWLTSFMTQFFHQHQKNCGVLWPFHLEPKCSYQWRIETNLCLKALIPKMTLVMLPEMWSWKVQTLEQWGEHVPVPSIALDALFTALSQDLTLHASASRLPPSLLLIAWNVHQSSGSHLTCFILGVYSSWALKISKTTLKDNPRRWGLHFMSSSSKTNISFSDCKLRILALFGIRVMHLSISEFEYIWKCQNISECLYVSMSILSRLQASWLWNAKDCNFKNFWFHVDESNLVVDQILRNVNTNSTRGTPKIS